VEQPVHDGQVGEPELEHHHRDGAQDRPHVAEHADLEHRPVERAAVEQVPQLDYDEDVDGHGAGFGVGPTSAVLPLEQPEGGGEHDRGDEEDAKDLALALVYGLGGWMALRGRLEPGTVVTLALLLTRLYAPLTALASARVDAMAALVSFERVFEVLDLPPLITEKPGARRVPDGPVSVELDGVRFAYPSADKVSLASLEEVATLDTSTGAEVLHGVSFRIEPGQLVALVGSSGSGKSTIAALAARLYDVDGGAVRLSGVDVRDLTFESIREALGVVTQDGHLFHDSIRENLRFARPEASGDELWDALRRARLADLVASLPDGLDTVVGERGYRLSGGERQRLTIARLLLARPRVVILDEATAHLDSTSEAAVQAALADALEGRTALVIAHRLSTVREADAILVVEDGRVVERGTHAELLAAGGRYAELHRTQFEHAPAYPRPVTPLAAS
jgi:ATP-binding cassette, subfamily B, bacterial